MQTIEIQNGVKIDFEELIHGVSALETPDLEKLADTLNHMIVGRKKPSPEGRETELLEAIENVVPAFVKQRCNHLQDKLRKGKISEGEKQELLQITDFMEEKALVRIHLMAELAALRQIPLKKLAEDLRKRRHDHVAA